MRSIAFALLFSVLGSASASAEVLVATQDNVPDDGRLTITLPAGDIEITMNTVESTGLFVHAGGSHEVLLDSGHMPRLLKIYEDSALLELNTGTSGCPILFAWVSYDAEGLRTSQDFGTCAQEARFEETADGPVVSMEVQQEAGKIAHYLYDQQSGTLSQRED